MRVIICAIAKNENNYINNWVNYYLNIGVDHIYLFDNNDKKTPYVGKFIEHKEKVTIFDMNDKKEKDLQQHSYTKFYNRHNKEFDWCFFIDIDEFLIGVDNVKDWLANPKFNNFDMIRIKWNLFGDDDLIERDESLPVWKSFHKIIKNNNLSNQAKCIVKGNLQAVKIGSCHYATNTQNSLLSQCLPSGKECHSKISIIENYSNETIFLNHYMTKTLKEFCEQKFGRGDAVYDKRNIDIDYFWRINKQTPAKIEWLKKNNYLSSSDNKIEKKSTLDQWLLILR